MELSKMLLFETQMCKPGLPHFRIQGCNSHLTDNVIGLLLVTPIDDVALFLIC